MASTVSTPLLSLPLQCHLQRATTWPPFSSFEGLEGELGSSRTGGSEGDPSGLQNCRQGWRMLRAGGGDTEGAATLGGGGEGSRLHRDSVQAAPGPLQLEDQSDHLTSEAWDFQTPGPPEENRRASRSHLRKTARGPESANHHQLWDETMHPFPPHNLPGARRIPCQPLHAAPGAGPEGSARDGGCGNPEAVNQSLPEETHDLTSGPVSDTGAPAELGALAGGPHLLSLADERNYRAEGHAGCGTPGVPGRGQCYRLLIPPASPFPGLYPWGHVSLETAAL